MGAMPCARTRVGSDRTHGALLRPKQVPLRDDSGFRRSADNKKPAPVEPVAGLLPPPRRDAD